MKIENCLDEVLKQDIKKCEDYMKTHSDGYTVWALVHKVCCQNELDKRKKLGISIQTTVN